MTNPFPSYLFPVPRIVAAISLGWSVMVGLPVSADNRDTEHPVTFGTDVMAVLSKGGCNGGGCHGNQNGKGGFQLSLWGQDPAFDYQQMTREFGGRRIDRLRPEQSLLLRKPTGSLAHRGGIRFTIADPAYAILFDWIDGGARNTHGPALTALEATVKHDVIVAPDDHVTIRVIARFADQSRRDVSNWVVYEPSNLNVNVTPKGDVIRRAFGEVTVMVRFLHLQTSVAIAFVPEKPHFAWSAPPLLQPTIDVPVFAKLKKLHLLPAPLCGDTPFVRRAYLDLTGRIPSANEAKAFLHDRHPDKRMRLVDRLLSRPEFADHWALKWCDILRNEEKVLDATGVAAYHAWIRSGVQRGVAVNQFVRSLLTSTGSTYTEPASNFYRANRDPTLRGETVARLFLGVRLQCARCHNHPYDHWTQRDYYDWAATFDGIDYEIVANERTDRLDKNEFVGEQVVKLTDEITVNNPATGERAQPRMLGGPPIDVTSKRLSETAAWLTAADNRQFVRNHVNWVWYHLMGRGIVDPVDDFRATNPPSNRELLDSLADKLVSSDFDLRALIRTIMSSHAYQSASIPAEDDPRGEAAFSQNVVRRLTAEQLLDAQCQVLGLPAEFNGYPAGMRAVQLPGVRKVRRRDQRPAGGDRFLEVFGKPQRAIACECERSQETTLTQTLMLIGGEGLHRRLTSPASRLHGWIDAGRGNNEILELLYWWALSRPPSEDEQAAGLQWLCQGDRAEAVQDMAWALLNAKEFLFRY